MFDHCGWGQGSCQSRVTTGARESCLHLDEARPFARSPQHNGPPSSCPGERHGVPNTTFISPLYHHELYLYLAILCALPRYLQAAHVLPNHSISTRVSLNLCESSLRLGSCTWLALPTVLSSRSQTSRCTKKRYREPEREGRTDQACGAQEEPI